MAEAVLSGRFHMCSAAEKIRSHSAALESHNAYHNIPRGKTQMAFLQLLTSNFLRFVKTTILHTLVGVKMVETAVPSRTVMRSVA